MSIRETISVLRRVAASSHQSIVNALSLSSPAFDVAHGHLVTHTYALGRTRIHSCLATKLILVIMTDLAGIQTFETFIRGCTLVISATPSYARALTKQKAQ